MNNKVTNLMIYSFMSQHQKKWPLVKQPWRPNQTSYEAEKLHRPSCRTHIYIKISSTLKGLEQGPYRNFGHLTWNAPSRLWNMWILLINALSLQNGFSECQEHIAHTLCTYKTAKSREKFQVVSLHWLCMCGTKNRKKMLIWNAMLHNSRHE